MANRKPITPHETDTMSIEMLVRAEDSKRPRTRRESIDHAPTIALDLTVKAHPFGARSLFKGVSKAHVATVATILARASHRCNPTLQAQPQHFHDVVLHELRKATPRHWA